MFIDQVTVHVKAGNGGNGIVAFRREKYVAMGGPAGGDGGSGGDVVFEVDEGLNTLMDFRYNRHFKAKHGINGEGKSRHGKNADPDRKSTRLNSSHVAISYAVFCLKKKTNSA